MPFLGLLPLNFLLLRLAPRYTHGIANQKRMALFSILFHNNSNNNKKYIILFHAHTFSYRAEIFFNALKFLPFFVFSGEEEAKMMIYGWNIYFFFFNILTSIHNHIHTHPPFTFNAPFACSLPFLCVVMKIRAVKWNRKFVFGNFYVHSFLICFYVAAFNQDMNAYRRILFNGLEMECYISMFLEFSCEFGGF